MAIVYPNLDKLKHELTEGELKLLDFFVTLPDDFEVFIKPFINGDLLDFVLLRKSYGGVIIKTCSWNIHSFKNINGKVRTDLNGKELKSPLYQIDEIKSNFHNLHVAELLKSKYNSTGSYKMIKGAVFFERAKPEEIVFDNNNPKEKYGIAITTSMLNDQEFFQRVLFSKTYLNTEELLFTDEIYNNIKQILLKKDHERGFGNAEVKLNKMQQYYAKSEEGKEQKIKGPAGSGKTSVLIKRAVNAHLRTKDRVLILTYNITLINYIQSKLSNINDSFSEYYFNIINYHQFISSELNNIYKPSVNNSDEAYKDFDDINLFEGYDNQIKKYKTILIDEIQDYQTEWITIIKKYFLEKGGELVLFGDENQNIYHRIRDNNSAEKINTGISGPRGTLKEAYRIFGNLAKVANTFKISFLNTEEKSFEFGEKDLELQAITYQYFSFQSSELLLNIVAKLNGYLNAHNISLFDCTFLGSNYNLLRKLDFILRKSYQIKTITTFETEELNNKITSDNNRNGKLEIEKIRKSKKLNFKISEDACKISTVHSFKGRETNTLIFFIDEDEDNSELIYTAITRCKQNLIIVNIGNTKYHEFFDTCLSSSSVFANIIPKIPEANIQSPMDTVTMQDIGIEKDVIITANEFIYNYCDNKYKIAILGDVVSKEDINRKIGEYCQKIGASVSSIEVKFYGNEKIKNDKGLLKSFKKGQSSCNIIFTGQIHQHSSIGNEEANLLEELKKDKYIESIHSNPREKLKTEDFMNKLEDYFQKKIAHLS